MSGKACRLAPVAIDETELSELYVARRRLALSWYLAPRTLNSIDLYIDCAPENRQLTGPLEAVAPGSGLSLR